MQSDLFSCPICYVQYDEDEHLPKVIPTCGHSLCSACITQILHKNKECPLDRAKFPNLSKKTHTFPVNYVLLQLIKEKLSSGYEICAKHDKPKNFVCTIDYLKICSECALSHTDHNIQAADDIQKEAQNQKKKLKSIIDEIKNHREEVESSLKASKKTVITVLTQEFDKIRDTIKEKEREVLSKIESAYDARKEQIGKALEKDEILREKCELKIADLEAGMNKRFFKTLEKLDKEGIIPPVREMDYEMNIREEEYISALGKLGGLLKLGIQDTHFEPQPLENLLDFEIQDQQSLIVDPRYSFPNEPSFLDYSLLKKIKILRLNCYGYDFSQEHFNAMKRVYTLCDELSDLRLFFANGHWYFYSDPLWATKKTESLTLRFKGHYDDDPIIKLIKNVLTKMTEIKGLSISLAETRITDQSVATLASYFIKNALNLSKFSLNLKRTAITDSSIAELCKNMNQFLENIKDFRLELTFTKISDTGLEILVQEGISLMDNLETFELYLFGTSITDQSFGALCGNANNLLKTKRFVLDIGSTKITEKNLILLNEKIISKMLFVEDLTLELARLQLTDKDIQRLSSSIAQISKNLKNLRLTLGDNQITDTGFIYLINQLLPELKGLKGLELIIYDTSITDNSIPEICVGLQHILKRVETFILGLGYCRPEVSEASMKMILGTVDLESMPYLKNFDIENSHIWDEENLEKLTEIREQLRLRTK